MNVPQREKIKYLKIEFQFYSMFNVKSVILYVPDEFKTLDFFDFARAYFGSSFNNIRNKRNPNVYKSREGIDMLLDLEKFAEDFRQRFAG